jgi:hypothetical protein
MTYSYTQISQYLTCPRRYRHRYLDGWQEKDTRAAMLFGRAFEQALGAYFRREDVAPFCSVNGRLSRTNRCTTQKAIAGIGCCNKAFSSLTGSARMTAFGFASRAATCRSSSSGRSLQTTTFVAYVDAIGKLDGTRCLIEWKTTSARYPEEPEGLLSLDPQLVCYSWMTGISEVAQVVFARKRLVEVQYLRTTITDEQRNEFGQLLAETIGRIESAQFLPHSGIRFPQNPCSTCPYVGLCLGQPELAQVTLVRRPGAENLGWLDELAY